MKRLILCCDGTWNKADQSWNGKPCPTNVLRLACRVAKRDEAKKIPQVMYYRQGVGTGNWLDRLTGGAFGHGLEENIHDAYRFLVANYEIGDEIFLFGFSRGAFTARSLAGMIRKCGIVKRTCLPSYSEALALYRSAIRPNAEEACRFRATRCMTEGKEIPIRFIGVWDTVGALGIPVRGLRWLTRHRYEFHDTELSPSVQTACHALAIDEQRAPFVPALWQDLPKTNQTIEQVWFSGAHSDVGGGYFSGGISDISLQWMIDKSMDAGLVFDPEVTEAMPVPPLDPLTPLQTYDPLAPIRNSKHGLYRLTWGIDRVIGIAKRPNKSRGGEELWEDTTQDVHPCSKTRWDQDPNYRPRPLRDFFRRRRGISTLNGPAPLLAEISKPVIAEVDGSAGHRS